MTSERLIHDLLDLTRARLAGEIPVQRQPGDLAAMLTNLQDREVLFIDDTRANTDAATTLGMQTHHFTAAAALEADLRARALVD